MFVNTFECYFSEGNSKNIINGEINCIINHFEEPKKKVDKFPKCHLLQIRRQSIIYHCHYNWNLVSHSIPIKSKIQWSTMFILVWNIICYNQKNFENLHMQFYSFKQGSLSIFARHIVFEIIWYTRITYNQILIIQGGGRNVSLKSTPFNPTRIIFLPIKQFSKTAK